jgi:hypothetical protein
MLICFGIGKVDACKKDMSSSFYYGCATGHDMTLPKSEAEKTKVVKVNLGEVSA